MAIHKIIKPERRQSTKVESVPFDIRPVREKLPNVSYLVTKKQTFALTPVVKTRTRAKSLVEFKIWLKLYISKNPHLVFKKIHQSSFSNYEKQWIFFDTKRNVLVAKTEAEMKESIRECKHSNGRSIPTFSED